MEPTFQVSQTYGSMGSAPHTNLWFVDRCLVICPLACPLQEDVFSRTTRARIQTLLSRYSTTRAACLLASYSLILFVVGKRENAAKRAANHPPGFIQGLSALFGNMEVKATP